MNARELRIGNTIDFEGQYVVIEAIGDNIISYKGEESFGFFPISDFDPIPLTDQWLKDFEFTILGPIDYQMIIGDFIIEYDIRRKELTVSYNDSLSDSIPLPIDVEYVHHIQNIVADMTGKELTK